MDLTPRQPAAAAGDSRFSMSAAEPQALTDEPARAERLNPAEIIDQIVKKAVIRFRDGISEARIDLKPELLGHLRISISTENQQVTLRILTEHPLVKEIIESSAAQLRADLSSQGLQMEQLEVGVNGDRDRFGRQPENWNRPARRISKNTNDAASAVDHAAEAAASASPAVTGSTGIDTFV